MLPCPHSRTEFQHDSADIWQPPTISALPIITADLLLYSAFIFFNSFTVLCFFPGRFLSCLKDYSSPMFSRFFLCKPHLLLSFLSLYLFPIWSLILTAEEYCSISILHTPCINTNSRSLMSRTTAVVSSICEPVFLWEWNTYACEVHPRFTAPLSFLKWNIYDPCHSIYPF